MDFGSRSNKRKSRIEGSATQLQLPLLTDALNEADDLRSENLQLRHEKALLEAEILRLKSGSPIAKTAEAEAPYQAKNTVPTAPVATANTRVKLFQSLFCARDDVYAERWKKKDGSFNYSPAKLHEWESHTRNEKGKWQCGPGCQLLPLTAQVAEEHLRGQRTVGIYPLLKDETCSLLALDFDEADWSEDALAFLETCDAVGVPAYLERSRSGTGAHVWIFFDTPVRASQARSLGAFLISETKQRRYQLGFKSYDRMFPNQDTMPRGGFGNLIALPLQLEPRKAGNSVFVDRELQPYADQWTYLASVIRMRSRDLESIVKDASARDAIVTVPLSSDDPDSEEPWKKKPSSKPRDRKLKEPYPKKVSVVLSDMTYVTKSGFNSASLTRIMELAAFQNPEFYQKQATRQSTHDTPRVICCAENLDKYIALPRACIDSVKELFEASGITVEVKDERLEGRSIAASFKGELRDQQPEAANQIAPLFVRGQKREWMDEESITVIGSGGTAATIVAFLAGQTDVPINVVSRGAALFSRGEGYFEIRSLSDPGDWIELPPQTRRELIRRIDRGVVSAQNMRVINHATNIVHYRIDVEKIAMTPALGHQIPSVEGNIELFDEFNGTTNQSISLPSGFVVDATGFDAWWFRRLFVGELAQALEDPGLRTFLEEHVDASLAVPIHANQKELTDNHIAEATAWQLAQSFAGKNDLHMVVPMVAGLAQGPGFPNLTCLGLLANRVLEPFVQQ